MSHPAPTRRHPRPAAPSLRPLALVLAVLAPAWAQGCDVEWSGARFSVEKPAAGGPADTAAAEEPPLPPLPDGPLLYYVEADSTGRALAAPAARIGPGGTLEDVTLPDSAPAAWRARFDSAFYGSGRELALHSASRRSGSLVLSGHRTPDASCPPVAVGQLFVAPGDPVPRRAVALPGGTWPAEPGAVGPGARQEAGSDDRPRLFAPILAERLLRERGVARPYLAELAELSTVPFPESGRHGMAATYLIADTLAPSPPADSAVSLFYLARYDSARGYRPRWVRVHRYGPGGGKRAYAYVAAADGPDGRVHFLRRYGASSVQLSALWPDSAGDAGEVAWVGPDRCSPLRLVERAAAGD